VCGSIPLEFHLARRAAEALKVGNPRCTAYGAMLDDGDGGGGDAAGDRALREHACEPLVRCIAAFTGTHAHMATYLKGNNGRQGCRFGAPFPHDTPSGGGGAGARIVQLVRPRVDARLICRAADAHIAAASVRRERLAAVRSPATGTAARGHYALCVYARSEKHPKLISF
jgi:hypothetical protein